MRRGLTTALPFPDWHHEAASSSTVWKLSVFSIAELRSRSSMVAQVAAGRGTQPEGEAVPTVDGTGGKEKRHDLFGAELAVHLGVGIVGCVGASKQGQRLAPRER